MYAVGSPKWDTSLSAGLFVFVCNHLSGMYTTPGHVKLSIHGLSPWAHYTHPAYTFPSLLMLPAVVIGTTICALSHVTNLGETQPFVTLMLDRFCLLNLFCIHVLLCFYHPRLSSGLLRQLSLRSPYVQHFPLRSSLCHSHRDLSVSSLVMSLS